jgi:glycosyltransferase involved in cell wall biosynthesis
MKILAVQPYADGAGHYAKYAARISQNISRLGHQVVLCVNHIDLRRYLDEEPLFRLISLGPEYSFEKYDLGRPSSQFYWLLGRMRNNLSALRVAARLAKEKKFDVVQLFSYELVTTWLFLSIFRPADFEPIVIEIAAPNFASVKYYGTFLENLWRRIQRFALLQMLGSRVRAFNVYSESHAGELKKQLGLAEDFLVGVTSDSRSLSGRTEDKHGARIRIGLEDFRGPLFLFFGTLRRDKGLDTLLEAIRILIDRTKVCDFKVMIAGAPADWKIPEAAVLRDRHVCTRFEYIPEEQVDDYFHASDAIILPYARYYIGSSGPMYDACAHGLPVIASDVSEMGKATKERGIGFTVPPDDPDALADAMTRFLLLTDEEKEGYRNSAIRMVSDFTDVDVAKSYIHLYDLVLNGRKE